MAIKSKSLSPAKATRVRPSLRGGPINPPDVHGGPINPPDVHGGPINPPRSPLGLVSAYQSQVGVGVFLNALDRVGYVSRVAATRRADRRAIEAGLQRHAKEIERLLALGAAQRGSLSRTGLLGSIRVSKRGSASTLTIGKATLAVAYPQKEARAAVKAMKDGMGPAAESLWMIAAEAEDPAWAFVCALGMHRANAEAFTFTGEVLRVVNDVVAAPVYALKHRLNVKRPNQVDPTVETWLPTPTHASYPSGHATFAHAAAVVLSALCGVQEADALTRLADAVAQRRELAGLHTHLDSDEGRRLGTALGRHLVRQAASGASADLAPWRALFALASREWAS